METNINNEYMECDACSAKVGSYTLCKSCLHNRTLINEQRHFIDQLKSKLYILKQIIALD